MDTIENAYIQSSQWSMLKEARKGTIDIVLLIYLFGLAGGIKTSDFRMEEAQRLRPI